MPHVDPGASVDDPPVESPPEPPAVPAPPVPRTIEVPDASRRYELRIVTTDTCTATPPGGVCVVSGEVVVLRKGKDAEVQRIAVQRIALAVGRDGALDPRTTLRTGDFDFDGLEDLAVQDDLDIVHGATFRFFLYDRRAARFVESEALSDLTHQSVASPGGSSPSRFFDVDTARRRIVVARQGGCCYRETEQYAFVRGELTMMSQIVEDATGDAEIVTDTGVREGAKWCTVTSARPRRPTDPRLAPADRAPSPFEDSSSSAPASPPSDGSPASPPSDDSSASSPSDDSPSPPPIDVRDASKRYDFRVIPKGACSSTYGPPLCEVPAELVVLRKRTNTEVQRIVLDPISLLSTDDGGVSTNTARRYDYQGTFEVGDFNFDGQEDFAVQDGENGPYNGPTFSVFLYDARSRRFVESAALSDLTRESLGFFQVDAARRRIVTFGKGGCCVHGSQAYAFVHGALTLVASDEEDARGDTVITTHGELEGPRWCTTTKTRPKAADE